MYVRIQRFIDGGTPRESLERITKHRKIAGTGQTYNKQRGHKVILWRGMWSV